MNILKHMEAVFVAAAVLAVSGSHLIGTLPSAHAKAPLTAGAITAPPAVVVVSAKRMTAEEKARSLMEDRVASGSM